MSFSTVPFLKMISENQIPDLNNLRLIHWYLMFDTAEKDIFQKVDQLLSMESKDSFTNIEIISKFNYIDEPYKNKLLVTWCFIQALGINDQETPEFFVDGDEIDEKSDETFKWPWNFVKHLVNFSMIDNFTKYETLLKLLSKENILKTSSIHSIQQFFESLMKHSFIQLCPKLKTEVEFIQTVLMKCNEYLSRQFSLSFFQRSLVDTTIEKSQSSTYKWQLSEMISAKVPENIRLFTTVQELEQTSTGRKVVHDFLSSLVQHNIDIKKHDSPPWTLKYQRTSENKFSLDIQVGETEYKLMDISVQNWTSSETWSQVEERINSLRRTLTHEERSDNATIHQFGQNKFIFQVDSSVFKISSLHLFGDTTLKVYDNIQLFCDVVNSWNDQSSGQDFIKRLEYICIMLRIPFLNNLLKWIHQQIKDSKMLSVQMYVCQLLYLLYDEQLFS